MAGGFDHDAVVVGAGIAGLCAARELVAAGHRVLLLDKGRGVGGRMATRRLGSAVCDHGAQFFTVRGRAFGGIVTDAHAAGAVVEWCRGFTGDGADGAGDGHPRWRGARAMTDLPKRLAALLGEDASGRCTIRTDARVVAVGTRGTTATVALETATGPETLTAAGCLLTPPVPQSLALLAAGRFAAASAGLADALRVLEAIDYDPCFALMVVLDRPSRVPAPGAIRFPADGPGPLAWLADNQRKGISPVPALTAHATGGFSQERFDEPAAAVGALLEEQLRPWIDGDPATAIVERSLQRWKYALPTTIVPAPLMAVSHAPPIACCGDAFAGPRVEGAAASGLAAGRWLARVLAGENDA